MKICKPFSIFSFVCLAVIMLAILGCNVPSTPETDSSVERARISAITEFVQGPEGPQIKTLVELSDALSRPVKTPCTFRFELYEFQPVSSELRGQQLMIWSTFDLNDPQTNDQYWKDFLRGYEFVLPLEFTPPRGSKYVLEVTCEINQKRYSNFFKMQYQP